MSTFSIPVSGLLANEEALSVIGNNLANMSTTGYKSETPQFSDLFAQQLGTDGAGEPIQVGLGTQLTSTAADFSQGTIQNTGVPTDLAIQGDGFLEVQNGGVAMFTRDGNLSINAQGYLVTQDGSNVMGYNATNGVVNASGAVAPLVINQGQNGPPQATSNVQITMNLDASAAIGTTFSTAVGVYDSLGTSHVLTYNFTKTGANTWSYQITIPSADVGATGNPVVLNSGTLSFDGNGNLTSPSSNVNGITAKGLADGAANLSFNWQLFGANGSPVVTQVAGTSAASSSQQDGFASGSLSSFSIGPDGTIEGSFTNGTTAALGQIALATFPNSQGLLRVGTNNFMTTLASGLPTVGTAGTGGRGTIEGSSLESSNVDISSQFAQLIVAQSGYEASARAFNTVDDVIQTAISLVPLTS
jgi:flagellar hook protein FlgE